MRARIRWMVVSLLVLLLAIGGGFLGREIWKRKQDELRRKAFDLLPNVAQRIRDFHRVKVDDGRKVWEVSAREAQYFDEEEVVVVQQPAVSVFLRDGRVIDLRGREGKVYLGGRDLRQVELSGEIGIQLGEYSLRAEYARYDRQQDLIVAPGQVQISSDVFDIQGEQMEVDVQSQRLTMSKNVRMSWRPQPAE